MALLAAAVWALSAPPGWAVAVDGAPTSVTLTVGAVTGPAFSRVSLSATVAGPSPAVVPVGRCSFSDRGVPLAEVTVGPSGVCEYASTGFGPGDHEFAVTYVPAGAFTGSSSAPVTATYEEYRCLTGDSCTDPDTVLPPIPRGELVISTPYTPAAPFDLGALQLAADAASYSASAPFGSETDPAAGVTIIDTRSGGLPFSAHISATDFVDDANVIPASLLGFTGVTPIYIPGNAITADDRAVAATDVVSLGALGVRFATGRGPGSVFVIGRMALTGVPTSTPAGLYVSTVTFTLS